MKLQFILIISIVLLLSSCDNETNDSITQDQSVTVGNDAQDNTAILAEEVEFLSLEVERLMEEKQLLEDNCNELVSTNEKLTAKLEEEKDSVERMTELLEVQKEEHEDNQHFTRVAVCYIEDTFRSIIFNLVNESYEEVDKLLTCNIEILDGNLHTTYAEDPFVVPDGDFYFTIDYYSIDYDVGEGGVIYEFFDSNNDRIYFCIASFLKEEYTWYLDSIESTLEP